MSVRSVRILGPVDAVDADGREIDLRGPRHRAVLARLVVARGRTVPLDVLIEDLWGADLPAHPAGSVRTFVAALRAALETERPPRLVVTRGPGYAFEGAVDAWDFEAEIQDLPDDAVGRLAGALARWRGPALAGLDAPWARGERARLTELRLGAVEALGRARLDAGRPDEAVADLDAHTVEHPWREEGWRLLALALYRARREGDALAVLRRARARLADELGTDPGPALAQLETDVLRRAPHLDGAADGLWTTITGLGSRATLESTTTLLRTLAVHGGGPVTALTRHAATVSAAQELGDPALTARLLGAYDVPSVWTRSDDPAASAVLAAAAEQGLRGEVSPGTRARLLATVALETRGLPGPRGPDAALEAEAVARTTGDPAVLLHALAARTVWASGPGSAAQRVGLGEEIVGLATAHDRPTSLVHGHLVLMQAHSGLGDLDRAAGHAATVDELGRRHDSPGAGVLVAWFDAMRAASAGEPDAEERYRSADAGLAGAGMPGVRDGLLALALLGARMLRGEPAGLLPDAGPYTPWVTGSPVPPDPPPGHLADVLWILAGRASLVVGDRAVLDRAVAALEPAAGEVAGAGSGMLTFGPVADHLEVFSRGSSR
ncbi:BTAD domain-containing putative transcriptional regulator [Actinomycetospora atypica]|uniref:BTAD domain-containing putative transcriptional regulator n=1 Tax=Actinomycetospora atypica TaxID=1290095 RepID=A0ABV9YKT8_9PSEU